MKRVILFAALMLALAGGAQAQVVSQGAGGSSPWRVTFSGTAQPVTVSSGTVTFSNATIGISGDVSLHAETTKVIGTVNIAAGQSIAVTGTFWQPTQPVSIASMPSTPVTNSNLDIALSALRDALVGSGPKTLTDVTTALASLLTELQQKTEPADQQHTIIDSASLGTVTVTGGLTDTQLRASAVPVTATQGSAAASTAPWPVSNGTVTGSGSITTAGASCSPSTNCVSLSGLNGMGSVDYQLSGSFSGANLIPEISIDGGSNWNTWIYMTSAGVTGSNISGSTPFAVVTLPAGVSDFRLRASSLVSGTVGISLAASTETYTPQQAVVVATGATFQVQSNINQVGGSTVSTFATGQQIVAAKLVDANSAQYLSASGSVNVTGIDILAGSTVAQFDDSSPASVTEDRFSNVRMSSNRNLYQTIRDAAGNERGANVNSSNELLTSLSALPAFTAIPTFKIDQTTPGTTNGVQINAAIPAGGNVIGHVIADSGSTTAVTGNVAVTNASLDGTTLSSIKGDLDPLVTAGAGAYVRQDSTGTIAKETGGNLDTLAAATHLEDAPASDADRGVALLGVRRDATGARSGADGDYESLQLFQGWLRGMIAGMDPVSGNAQALQVSGGGLQVQQPFASAPRPLLLPCNKLRRVNCQ